MDTNLPDLEFRILGSIVERQHPDIRVKRLPTWTEPVQSYVEPFAFLTYFLLVSIFLADSFRSRT